jgi:hypothetical protein
MLRLQSPRRQRRTPDREDLAMRRLLVVGSIALSALAGAADLEWVEIGADTEARYYINPKSLQVEGDTIRLQKRQVFNQPLVDNFTGRPVLFKESIGVVELDCGRRINRVISVDMIGVNGEVVWSSGKMPKRLWEDVRENTHGETTFNYVCKSHGKS